MLTIDTTVAGDFSVYIFFPVVEKHIGKFVGECGFTQDKNNNFILKMVTIDTIVEGDFNLAFFYC